VKVIFDTSIWVEQLRRSALDPLLPLLRGKHQIWMDGLVAAELLAGCRSRIERRVVDGLLSPFRRTGRLLALGEGPLRAAGVALSKLREGGLTLKNPGAALLDAMIAATAVHQGALLVTLNSGDFAKLRSQLALTVESLDEFAARLAAT
jgi:predicted nucleic acid-binding protein